MAKAKVTPNVEVLKPLICAYGISNYKGEKILVKDAQLREDMVKKGYVKELKVKKEIPAEIPADREIK
jgi:hypothetical protein